MFIQITKPIKSRWRIFALYYWMRERHIEAYLCWSGDIKVHLGLHPTEYICTHIQLKIGKFCNVHCTDDEMKRVQLYYEWLHFYPGQCIVTTVCAMCMCGELQTPSSSPSVSVPFRSPPHSIQLVIRIHLAVLRMHGHTYKYTCTQPSITHISPQPDSPV